MELFEIQFFLGLHHKGFYFLQKVLLGVLIYAPINQDSVVKYPTFAFFELYVKGVAIAGAAKVVEKKCLSF
jgi:hypothetical protein